MKTVEMAPQNSPFRHLRFIAFRLINFNIVFLTPVQTCIFLLVLIFLYGRLTYDVNTIVTMKSGCDKKYFSHNDSASCAITECETGINNCHHTSVCRF